MLTYLLYYCVYICLVYEFFVSILIYTYTVSFCYNIYSDIVYLLICCIDSRGWGGGGFMYIRVIYLFANYFFGKAYWLNVFMYI